MWRGFVWGLCELGGLVWRGGDRAYTSGAGGFAASEGMS